MGVAGIARRSLLGLAGWLIGAPALALAAPAKPKVAIRTKHGVIVVELETLKAPLTSANFLRYVDAGKYDGGTFFRAARTPGAPKEGTIVGGPAPKQRPFPPIAHESTTQTGLRHVEGTISLGRFAPGSATDGFFICASAEPYLDAHPEAKGDNLGFAAFGQVVEGLPVVHTILALPTSTKAPFPDQKGQWLKPPVPILSMKRLA
ncbi:peptidylprolyl isomerase [Caulobacter sp. S45]|uniref:peptidylprolyl isomerase n=1 Tax=Caulobacter sp. S45 TaxID=1641861 RepID=UPI001575F8BD|nr:peptidylprolyl isomerase [Caulobacter sp. S45]